MSIFERLAVLTVALACLGAAHLNAAEPPADAQAAPVFRRVFIPADSIHTEKWNQRYLPVDAAEFERLVQTVGDAARGAPSHQAARLAKAEYQAQLVGEDLLLGSATWHTEAPSAQPLLLKLDPCNLALDSAAWHAPQSKPAVWGATREGPLAALVEGTQLDARWSLRGERTASGAVGFAFELPPCPITRLTLEAPASVEVLADRGVVTKNTTSVPSLNRWTIELGGHSQVQLRMVPEAAAVRAPLALVRQSFTYEFSSRGINVEGQLRLDVHGEPLARAAIDLDPSLHLVGVRYGESPVPWSASIDEDTKESHVLLEFPEPVKGAGRVLRLSAVAPLVTGQRVRLPAMRPQNMAWQEGTAELLLPDSLALEHLSTQGCRQSRVEALAAPLAGESIEIQYYRPDATIEVLVNEPRKPLHLSAGTLVEVGTTEITSRAALEITLATGQRRSVRIPVAPGWTVDAVESRDAKGAVDWDLEESPGRPATLKIDGQTGRFAIRGHRPLPDGDTFEARQLQMLDLDAFQIDTCLISVHAAEASELRWSGSEELTRLDPRSLLARQVGLFLQPPEGLVFAEDAAFAATNIVRQRRKPSFTADIHIDAAVQKGALAETYTIHCVPDAARVERLLVHFSHARNLPLEWNLAGGNSGEFSARKLSPAEQAQSNLPAGGEVWELLLHLARPGAFELKAQRSSPFSAETPLPLMSVDAASTQRGTVAIRALGEAGLSIKNRQLKSVPSELLQPDRYQTARATYAYQPSRDDLGAEPAVSIAPADPQQSMTGAWAWDAHLESRYGAGGTCVHQATYHLQTAGKQQLRLTMPEGAELLAAWLDTQRLPLVLATDKQPGQRIELASGRARTTLTLYYSTSDALPTLSGRFEPPFPELDIPLMHRSWSVWLPPGYALADGSTPLVASTAPTWAAPTWTQRLFGPLGRGPRGRIFNPLVAADWRDVFFGRSRLQTERSGGEAFLDNLDAALADYLDNEELTWGQLLASLNDTETQAGRTLLVDAASLRAAGVRPQDPVRYKSSESSRQPGASLLAGAELVAAAGPAAILITSAAAVTSYPHDLSPPNDSLCIVNDGALAEQLHSTVERGRWAQFETIELWRMAAARDLEDWTRLEDAALAASDPRGWTSYTLSLAPTGTAEVRVVQAATMQSLVWAVFLGVLAVGLWSRSGASWPLVALAAGAAALALLVPGAYAPLFSAALLAALCCLAARMIKLPPRRLRREPTSRLSKPPSKVVPSVATLLLATALLQVAAALDAQQPAALQAPPRAAEPRAAEPAQPAPATADIYRVVIPVDDEQQPTGGKYLVPEPLLAALHRQGAAYSGLAQDWIVSKGSYQATLTRDAATAEVRMAGLTARFELQVFQTNTTVRLPLPRSAWSGAIVATRLDGRAIAPLWDAAGEQLLVGPLDAERYRLELDLKPALSDASGRFELPIPPLANATLELALPSDAPSVEVRGARGQIVVDRQRGQLTAHLGPTSRLAIRWPVGAAATPNLEVDELIWVKIRPGTTVLDARFTYRLRSGRVRSLKLLADPRLRLLSTADISGVTAVHTVPGDPQQIELEMARDAADQAVIDMSFLVTGTSGVGNLRLPRLESSDAKVGKRWLAVSVEQSLQPKFQTGEEARSLETGEFVTAWGPTEAKPLAAYAIPRGEPQWVVATQPSEPQTAAEQSLAISLGRTTTNLRFDANLTVTGGVLVQLPLVGPPGIVVDRVSVQDEGVERVARYSASPDGEINVFLTAPLDGKPHVSLIAHWQPPSGAEAFDAPRLRVAGAELKKSEVHLYRQQAVLAAIEKPAAAKALEQTAIEVPEGFGARLSSFTLDDPATPVRVQLTPNDPQLKAVAVTTLARNGDQWIAELDYHVDVQSGLVDSLTFEIPQQWSEPFQVEPEMRTKVVAIPGEQRRQLVVTPRAPLSGKSRLHLRGRVALSPGDRLGVPDIVPLKAQQVDRFVILPQHLDQQQVTWDILGMSPAELPAEFASRAARDDKSVVYHVAADHFQASLKAVERASAKPIVKLCDVRVVWQTDGSYQAVATFDLEPGGSTRAVLELPSHCKLLHATVEQLPAQLTPQNENRWQLGLGPQQLPQHIEVVYTGALAASPAHVRLEAPRLVDLDVAETLWTIHADAQLGTPEPRQTEWRLSAADFQLRRLQSISSLAQLPAEVIGEHLPEEIARWYTAWQQRYWSGRTALQAELIAARRLSAQSEEDIEARALDKKMAAVDQRLGAGRANVRQALSGDSASRLVEPPHAMPIHCAVRGGDRTLELRYPHARLDRLMPRVLLALALAAGGGCLAYWLRGRRLPTIPPWLLVAVVGLAAWLLLGPSAWGLAALAAAAAFALTNRWHSARAA